MHGPWEIVQLAFCQTGPIDKPNYGKFNVLNAYCASKGSHLPLKNRWAVAPRTVLIIVIFLSSRDKEYLETGAQCFFPNVYK